MHVHKHAHTYTHMQICTCIRAAVSVHDTSAWVQYEAEGVMI